MLNTIQGFVTPVKNRSSALQRTRVFERLAYRDRT
jgi:hypothetical protein